VIHSGTGVFAVVGSVCMTSALALAWCLVGVQPSRFVKRCFPNPQYLLKAPLDFLMTTKLLFIFFLVFEHFRITPPMAIVVAMSVGSLGNPSGFLALVLKPDLPQKAATPFGAVMLVSVTVTTVGFGGAAWYVAHAILHTGLWNWRRCSCCHTLSESSSRLGGRVREVGGIRSRSSLLSRRPQRGCVVLRAVRGDERLDSDGGPGVSRDDSVRPLPGSRGAPGSSLVPWPAMAFRTPFTATSSRTPACPPGGWHGVLRMTSAPRARSPGS
jgi:hypothetical protein